MSDDNTRLIRQVLGKAEITATDIIYALSLKNESLSGIAKSCGVSRPTVCAVVYGHRSSFEIALEIASVLGTTTERLWKGKYNYKPKRKAKVVTDTGRYPISGAEVVNG